MNKTLLLKLIVTYVIYFISDRIYLSFMSEKISKQIEKVQKSPVKTNHFGTLLLNILVIIGMYLFIIEPNANLLNAFYLGFMIQGTMNATNMTVFEEWKLKITIIDTVVGGLQTLFAVYLARKIV